MSFWGMLTGDGPMPGDAVRNAMRDPAFDEYGASASIGTDATMPASRPKTPKARDPEEYLKSITQSAADDLRARSKGALERFVRDHEQDTAAYRFECKRWGDFLAVFVERAALQPHSSELDQLEKLSASINIGQSRAIRFVEGHAPDTNGRAFVVVIRESIRRHGWSSDERFQAQRTLMEGGVLVAEEAHGSLERRRIYPTLVLDAVSVADSSDRWVGVTTMDRGIPVPVDEIAQFAADDRIIFEGAGATLFVPAGLGRGVHEQIMRELAQETCIVDDDAEHGTLIRQGERLILMVRCPSTGKAELLSVPPRLRTAAEARAWTFGLTAKEFNTEQET